MKRTVLSLVLLLISSVSMAADVPGDFNAAVRSVGKEFQDAFPAKDSAKVGSLYAADAMIFPPNSEMVKGRENIQNFWKGLMDAGMSAKLEVLETENQGNLGFETGRYTILGADGKTADQGKYIVVWKKDDSGGWKLYRDIWNSSMAAAASK